MTRSVFGSSGSTPSRSGIGSNPTVES
ncbi:hypothetical protein CCACVL1_03117, partial [Corchorus capsularis]